MLAAIVLQYGPVLPIDPHALKLASDRRVAWSYGQNRTGDSLILTSHLTP